MKAISHTLCWIIITLLGMITSFEAEATIYYVAPTGNDNNLGTQTAPFKSIMKAHSVVVAGDTIYLRGGTHRTPYNGIKLTKSGTSTGGRIKLFAYPKEKPVIDASPITNLNTWAITLNSSSWWHIKGLEIVNNPRGGGIYLGNGAASNNIIENNNIHHNGFDSNWAATGISVYGLPANNLFLNNDSHHNSDRDFGDGDGISGGNLGVNNIYRGNRLWNNSDDGFDFFCVENNANCATVLLENNWVFNNGYGENGNPLGDGNGFKLGGIRAGTNGKSGGHTLRNNLAWSNLRNGFDDNNSTATITQAKPNILYNNTAFNNGSDNYSFWGPVNHIFKNNISLGFLGHINGSATYNSWNLSVTVNNADFSSVDDACARGPRKADGSLPDCSFLRLASNSDLINRGTNVGLAYSGTAPDLGAFEFSGVPTSTVSPDVVVTATSYNASTRTFSSTIKNQGTGATPANVYVGLSYSIDGRFCTWGSIRGPLAAGASVVIGMGEASKCTPSSGAHTLKVVVDDVFRFAESSENNNTLLKTISIP